MKYCVPYSRGITFNYYDEVAEMAISYNPKDNTLPAFVKEHSGQGINITLAADIEDYQIEMIRLLSEQYKNIKVVFDFREKELLDKIKEAGIPYFFSNFVSDWDMLNYELSLSPTDVYITNEMCFSLGDVNKVCNKCGAAIRVIPHIAQSSDTQHSGYTKFFIRPEDMYLYEEYVDVIDFFTTEHLNVVYKVWAKDKEWFGNLREIIANLGVDFENRNIGFSFAATRCNCGKKCMHGKSCRICQHAAEASKSVFNKGFLIKRKN